MKGKGWRVKSIVLQVSVVVPAGHPVAVSGRAPGMQTGDSRKKGWQRLFPGLHVLRTSPH